MRLLFSALAYLLLERLRALALQESSFARLQVDTIRLKLLKIGGIVLSNTRQIRLLLSEYFPSKETYFLIARRLAAL